MCTKIPIFIHPTLEIAGRKERNKMPPATVATGHPQSTPNPSIIKYFDVKGMREGQR